jgi:MHS family proline/betaine transporter-like MFS transporter
MTATTTITPEQQRTVRRAVVASSMGNALEWFDIIVYASFAVVISRLFFPESDGVTGLLFTFGAFATSYLIRPLGALVLGSYADRSGRKNALTLTIAIMTVGTAIMAFAPTAATIGSAAGLVILLSRLLQGFSAGGEFGTATTFLVENAPHRKAFYASWQVATQGLAMLMASAFGFGLNYFLSTAQLDAWGWRIPFFFGLLVGPVGLYIRLKMDETPEFAASEKVKSPVVRTLVDHTGRVLSAAAAVGLASISVYLILYMPTFAVTNLDLPRYAGFLGGIISGLVSFVGVPFVGKLADRVGPLRIMLPAAVPGAGGEPVGAGADPGPGGAGHPDGVLLRPGAGAAVLHVPDGDPHHRAVHLLQPRGDAVRRVRAHRADLADRRQRQPAVAELLLHGRRRGVHPRPARHPRPGVRGAPLSGPPPRQRGTGAA